MMQAAVLTGAGGVELARCAPPAPGPGQLRVRLEGTGVCGSNVPVWEGRPWFDYPRPPGSPGHEGWGEVDAIGAGVETGWLGRRVAMLSEHAYAEWDVAGAEAVVPVPAGLESFPCPGEPLACAVNVMRRAAVRPGELVVVVGVGFLGAALVALARHAGARVVAVSRRRYACRLAESLGALTACTVGEDDGAILGVVNEATSGALADCVIEAVGTQRTLDLAAALTRVRGRLVIAGYHQDGLRQVDMQLWNWRGLDVINAHERDQAVYVAGMREALSLASDGVLPLGRLITHSVPLADLGRAFTLMAERPDGFLKAIVTCRT